MDNKKLEEIKGSLKEAVEQPEVAVTTTSSKALEEEVISNDLMQPNIKSNDGFNLLGSILETAFFYTLFEHIAKRQFSARTTALRVTKMRIQHPCIYQLSIAGDFIVRIIVVLILVAAAAWSVYKVLR